MADTTLSKANELWDAASVFAEQQIGQWAKNERLTNGKHLTPRKPGRSALFVPKIPGYVRRKHADYVGQFSGDSPISIKNTITSHPLGAKIKQGVHNYYLQKYIDYDALIYNTAYCGLVYNNAPVHIEWIEETIKEKVMVVVSEATETSDQITKMVDQETVVNSYPVIEALPPEDARIDQSTSWDDIDEARYLGFRKFIDANYAKDMHDQGKWPKVEESEFTGGTTTATSSSTLTAERSSQASPFASTSVDIDNGLAEVRYHYYFKLVKKDYIPVRTVTLNESTVLEDEVPIEINWGGDKHAWPMCVGQVYPKPFEQYAPALPEQAKDSQIETNAIRNQRRDNVSLILNPEKYVTPFAGITADQLAFSFPGKVVTVDNLNAIQWQTVPDVTAAGHNEETRVEADMDRMFSEGPLRSGVEGSRKESATAIMAMSSNSSAATGLDTFIFRTSLVKPLNEKLGNAIAQKAPEEIFEAAAMQLNFDPNSRLDPTLLATEGDFIYNVYSSASNDELSQVMSMNSNIMGLIQTVYGPNANYKPLVDEILEIAGHDPDSIIPNPMSQGLAGDPALGDPGGREPGGKPSIQPRAQFSGGGMPQGSGNQSG